MNKYKAKKTFSGKITKAKGEIFFIEDNEVVNDLLEIGYIEEVNSTSKKEIKDENK